LLPASRQLVKWADQPYAPHAVSKVFNGYERESLGIEIGRPSAEASASRRPAATMQKNAPADRNADGGGTRRSSPPSARTTPRSVPFTSGFAAQAFGLRVIPERWPGRALSLPGRDLASVRDRG